MPVDPMTCSLTLIMVFRLPSITDRTKRPRRQRRSSCITENGVSPVHGTCVSQGSVDLPVRGAAGEPALMTLPWHTPVTDGHYCLMAVLNHPERSQSRKQLWPNQHGHTEETKALKVVKFDIPVRHSLPGRRTLRLQMTSYRLPAEPMFPDVPESVAQRYEEEVKRLGDCARRSQNY